MRESLRSMQPSSGPDELFMMFGLICFVWVIGRADIDVASDLLKWRFTPNLFAMPLSKDRDQRPNPKITVGLAMLLLEAITIGGGAIAFVVFDRSRPAGLLGVSIRGIASGLNFGFEQSAADARNHLNYERTACCSRCLAQSADHAMHGIFANNYARPAAFKQVVNDRGLSHRRPQGKQDFDYATFERNRRRWTLQEET
jgi:hypothetical protein